MRKQLLLLVLISAASSFAVISAARRFLPPASACSVRTASVPIASIRSDTSLRLRDVPLRQTNIVLAVSSFCPHCVESMPFYKKLASELRRYDSTYLAVITRDTPAKMTAYLREQQVSVDGVFPAELASVNVQGTPTLWLVDQRGNVLKEYIGTLSPNDEKEVLSILRESQRPRKL